MPDPSPRTVVLLNWVWLIGCSLLIVVCAVCEFIPGVKTAGRIGLLVPIAGGLFRGYFDGLGPILDRYRARRRASPTSQ